MTLINEKDHHDRFFINEERKRNTHILIEREYQLVLNIKRGGRKELPDRKNGSLISLKKSLR